MNKKLVVFLTLLIAAAACFWIFNPAKSTEVLAVKPQHVPAVQAVYATGTVEASRMIPISPKIAARLMTLEVDEGSRVTAGQLLAQLEDTDVRENLTEAEANLDLAQKDLERAQKLGRSGAISKEALDSALAAHKTAAAAVERRKAELSYLQLLAPEDGTIIRRDGEIGELVTPTTAAANSTPIFWMNGGDEIRIETEVDEEDIGLVQPGQKVLIGADAFPRQVFNGIVQSITPKGDAVARSYRVRVTMDGQTPLMIGMTAETNIITQEKDDARMVPLTSVKDGMVIRIAAGKAENVAVTTGIKTPKTIEILEGVNDGDLIAEKYDALLLEAGKIRASETAWDAKPKI
jgi:multidrug efflux system membrane fusion protein